MSSESLVPERGTQATPAEGPPAPRLHAGERSVTEDAAATLMAGKGLSPEHQAALERSDPNGKATAALVLGVVGLFAAIPLVFSALAIVFGSLGIAEAKRQPGRPGYGRANWGLSLGILGLVAGVGFWIGVALGA